MVVTDLHGDWEAYVRCRDRFTELRAAGLYLLFDAGRPIERTEALLAGLKSVFTN